MNKVLMIAAVCGVATASLQAQSLYQPRNIKNAFLNQTRSESGRPGAKYWQNGGDYSIQFTAEPTKRLVRGKETIVYSNNSPVALKSLVMRFVNNIHKPGAARSGPTAKEFLTDGLRITSFKVDGVAYNTDGSDWSTIYTLGLAQPLAAGAKATIDIEWNYDLSILSGREGMLDSTTMYVAYGYPRVSVFDDYNGWDRLEHSDRGEFYNDFNNYDISFTAPKNYVVYGTGDFLNPDEVLMPTFAKRLKESYISDSILHIANFSEMLSHQVTQQNDWNTWKFKATHISDVCFAVSDHYVWDGGSVQLHDNGGRRVSMQAAYNDTAVDFHDAVKYGKFALKKFSNNWPGVDYPYPKMTAVQGQADMEYPMMVNDATVGDNARFAQMLQDHEMAHTYFPFYMGINETRYAYMDEGWATTLEYLIGIDEYGKANADTTYMNFRVNRYTHDPSTEEDQPIISMSSQVSGAGYGNNSYGKASLSYLALKDLLGDQLFKKALHNYMDNWNGKHPIPWDYFNSMNAGAGQNLNWFFQNWFFSNNYIDLKINKIEKKGKSYLVDIDNVGGFAIPFDVVTTEKDGSEKRVHQTPAVWKENGAHLQISIPATSTKIRLDGGLFMDATEADNVRSL